MSSTTNKSILITGVTSGIGYDATQYLLDNGYFVFGSVRSREDAEKLSEVWSENFYPLIFDVTDENALSSAYNTVSNTLAGKGLYGLVNNAGIALSGPLKHMEIAKFRHQLEVNVLGLVNVTQKFLPLLGGDLNSQHPPGRIINISSISGLLANPFMGAYSASKHAVEAVTDTLRRELSIYAIKVVAVEPGIVQSEIWEKAKEEKYEFGPTDYDSFLEKRERIIEGMQQRAIPTRRVSRIILKALEAKDPKTRYVVAKKAWLIRLFAYIIPDKILDRLILKNMKGNNIRPT